MTLLLKEWMIENQRVSQMEKAHVLSEVEQLKEQVSPELLFKTLHHSGELTLTKPEKASKMLMKLSQLLTISYMIAVGEKYCSAVKSPSLPTI